MGSRRPGDRMNSGNDDQEPARHPRGDDAKLRLAQRLLGIGLREMEIETGRLIWSDNV